MERAKQKGSAGEFFTDLDIALLALEQAKDRWAQTDLAERIKVLSQIKDNVLKVAADWAETAARKKQIPPGSPLEGEEWIAGPYALMGYCNGLIQTLAGMDGKKFLNHLRARKTETGQTAVQVLPQSVWEHLLFSGVKAEVWMLPGVTKDNLARHTAQNYDTPANQRMGKVALVLGAGNIAAISPLDAFQKLFLEHQVIVLKMNPVNDYLNEFLETALKPLIERDALRIVKGGADVGAYLCNHPKVKEIHITGSAATHDAIVWGQGAQGVANKKAAKPKLAKPISSELGAVCPTIVVPGPWSRADLKFQAEHIATQKLHNSGFNCIACQVLILPQNWDSKNKLLKNVQIVMENQDPRGAYYPGAKDRMADFSDHTDNVVRFDRGSAPACVVAPFEDGTDQWFCDNEVFAPAFSTHEIAETDPATYLKAAIGFANENLYGTLGGNILIHPKTIREIGRKNFEAIIAEFHYGTIAINTWTGLGFLITSCPWGAFPGHTLDNVESGIGFVHNTFMFDSPERVVVSAPFRPFPRNILSGSFSLLPRPPWFITNKKQHKIGRLLTQFQHSPGWAKIPRIFMNALLG